MWFHEAVHYVVYIYEKALCMLKHDDWNNASVIMQIPVKMPPVPGVKPTHPFYLIVDGQITDLSV